MNNENAQTEQTTSRVFNPNEHMMQIRSGQTSKDYLPVQWRLVWFRTAFPHGTIETEMLHLDMDRDTEEEGFAWNADRRKSEKVIKQAKGFCVFRAVVKDGIGGIAVGTKSEKAASFGDFIEKAETGAIGRALAALGYGTQFTGDEFEEQHRIVDGPVERPAAASASTGTSQPAVPANAQPTTNTSRSGESMTVSGLRARFDVVKPSGKDGAISFENFYKMATKKPFTADDAISPEECQKINQQLDVIVRARANKQHSA